jgi:predicted RNase H-like nuclease (RuvC/YqgF family)
MSLYSFHEFTSKYPKGTLLEPCVQDMERRIFELEKTIKSLQWNIEKLKRTISRLS